MAGVKPAFASQATTTSVPSVKKSAVTGTGVKSANKASVNKKSQQQQIELIEEDISKSVIGMSCLQYTYYSYVICHLFV